MGLFEPGGIRVTEKVYSFGVIDNFMELVLNHHREMVLQLLQQLQQQLEFSLFEKKPPIFFFQLGFSPTRINLKVSN